MPGPDRSDSASSRQPPIDPAVRPDGQRRLYHLRTEPLMELDAWLAPFRRFWSRHVDALEQHLDKMEKVPSVKGKKKT